MAHPIKFSYHVGKDLIVNGKDIFHHTEEMLKAYYTEDHFNFGLQLGEILEELFVGHKVASMMDANKVVFKNVL